MARRPNQLTVRDLDPRVLAEIERLVRSEGLSLNKAAAQMLKAGAGMSEAKLARKAGTPIPTNDVWIAAHAFETGAELITFDRHFESVRGLPVSVLRRG